MLPYQSLGDERTSGMSENMRGRWMTIESSINGRSWKVISFHCTHLVGHEPSPNSTSENPKPTTNDFTASNNDHERVERFSGWRLEFR